MKISYTKIYIPELIAHSHFLTPHQIGLAVLGVCQQAFFGETDYVAQNAKERALFEMLTEWKDECYAALKQKRAAGRKGGKARCAKQEK
jgi:hypothetical protein